MNLECVVIRSHSSYDCITLPYDNKPSWIVLSFKFEMFKKILSIYILICVSLFSFLGLY